MNTLNKTFDHIRFISYYTISDILGTCKLFIILLCVEIYSLFINSKYQVENPFHVNSFWASFTALLRNYYKWKQKNVENLYFKYVCLCTYMYVKLCYRWNWICIIIYKYHVPKLFRNTQILLYICIKHILIHSTI